MLRDLMDCGPPTIWSFPPDHGVGLHPAGPAGAHALRATASHDGHQSGDQHDPGRGGRRDQPGKTAARGWPCCLSATRCSTLASWPRSTCSREAAWSTGWMRLAQRRGGRGPGDALGPSGSTHRRDDPPAPDVVVRGRGVRALRWRVLHNPPHRSVAPTGAAAYPHLHRRPQRRRFEPGGQAGRRWIAAGLGQDRFREALGRLTRPATVTVATSGSCKSSTVSTPTSNWMRPTRTLRTKPNGPSKGWPSMKPWALPT